MGYMHIQNLSKYNAMLIFKELYALEKIDGTSAHVRYTAAHVDATGADHPPKLTFFSGCAKHDQFVALFRPDLLGLLQITGLSEVIVYGEAYGGKIQGMSETYGKDLKFVAFDVLVKAKPELQAVWLEVPSAERMAHSLGLDFVSFELVQATAEALNAERDRPSRQAIKNGMGDNHIAEGVVVRPIIELTDKNGNRLMAKHKRPEFSERLSKKDTSLDPTALAQELSIRKTASEWATPRRLEHVENKLKAALQRDLTIKDTEAIINAMCEDIYREGAGEVTESKALTKAIGALTGKMFIAGIRASL